MSHLKVVIQVAILVFLACGLAAQGPGTPGASASPKLVLLAKAAKHEFKLHEPIFLDITVRNDSAEAVLISPAMILGYDVTVKIVDSNNSESPWCGVVSQWRIQGKKFAALKAGASFHVRREISCDKNKDYGYSITAPGMYRAVVSYRVPPNKTGRNSADGKLRVASGTYVSDAIEFSVASQ